jgi:antitoxin ParD1/3/4
LGDHFDSFVDEQVRRGRFGDASAVVREALRLLEDRERDREARIAEIRRSIEEGRQNPVHFTEDEVFGPLESKYGVAQDQDGA